MLFFFVHSSKKEGIETEFEVLHPLVDMSMRDIYRTDLYFVVRILIVVQSNT